MKNKIKYLYRLLVCFAFVWLTASTANAQNAGTTVVSAGSSTGSWAPTKSGYYFVEAWGGNGAAGGSNANCGTAGAGGSSTKVTGLYLWSTTDRVNIQVGNAGNPPVYGQTVATLTTAGTWFGNGTNGGASGTGGAFSPGSPGGGGGAASGILLNGTAYGNIRLVSGGGGGGGGGSRDGGGGSGNGHPGSNGSATNQCARPNTSAYQASDCNGTHGGPGGKGENGNLVAYSGGGGGGGGGGYAGGFGAPAAVNGAGSNHRAGGGGGGQNYVSGTSTGTSYITNNRPNTANGYVYITYLGNQVSKVSDIAIPTSICGTSYTLPMAPKTIENSDSYGVTGAGVWQVSTTSTFASITTLSGQTPAITSAAYNNYYIRYRYTSRVTGGYIYSNTVQIKFIDCSCSTNGTLLFLEDFGGDAPSDPVELPSTNHPKIGRFLNGTTNLAPTAPGGLPGGTYVIRKNLIGYNTGWVDFTQDASTPHGYLMAINAAGDGKVFYEMTIDGLCGLNLFFSAKIGNLVKTDIIHPNLRFQLYNAANNALLATYDTGEIPYSTTAIWRDYGFPFTVPEGVSSIICRITDKQVCYNSAGEIAGDCGGNDFVIDDIKVMFCAAKPVIRGASEVARCGTNTFTADYVNDGVFGTNLVSYWEYSTVNSPNDPSTWSEVAGTRTTQTISVGGTLTSTLIASREGYYRLAVSNPTSINISRCRTISNGARFLALNPAIQVKCLEQTVQTCESEYLLRATYADDGTLGNNLCYVWEYLAPGNTQNQWTPIESTRECVTNGFIIASYMASTAEKGTGYYRLSVISSSIGCTVPSDDTYVIFFDSPSFDLHNPPAAACGQSANITAASIVIPPVNPTITWTYWRDVNATSSLTPAQAAAIEYSGIYFVKATNPRGCSTIKPVQVTIEPCDTDDNATLAVNQQTRMTFFGGPFIPSTIGPGTIDGRTCYNVTGSEISGAQSYRFTATTNNVRNVSYHILDPNGLVDTNITRLNGVLVPGPLPNGSSIAMSIWFKDGLPSSVNGVVTLYIIYNNGTENVRVEKEITLQGTDCVGGPVIPGCRPLEVVMTQRQLANGDVECRANVGGGATNTFEWYVDGVRQAGANTNVFTLTKAGKEPGAYAVQAIVLSGCEECDIQIARVFAIIQPDISATATSVKVTYGTAASTAGGSFTKPVDFPAMDVRVWGAGAGGGRAVAWGRTTIFLNRDGVAAGGGGGGGGFARGTIPESYSGSVTATVGARTTGVAASGGSDRQAATVAGLSRVTWATANVTGNGGAGGYSSVGEYGVDNGVSGGAGGAVSSTGVTCVGCQVGTRGGNGTAVDPGTREWARGGAGGGINGGSSVGGPSHTITNWTEARAIQGNNGIFPGGGGSGAIALKVQGIFTSVRAKGGDGANGMVTMDFTYNKPTKPIISLDRPAVNTYAEPVTLRIENQFYAPDNTAYQWYVAPVTQPTNFTAVPGATGQTLRVESAGVYKVVAVRRGATLPASISFTGAANVSFVNNNNDGSSISGTTLNIGTARNAVESRTITFN